VTVVAAMGLSSVSGTAVADATALGGTLGPALSKAYGKPFGAALVAASSCLGPIIPPSAGMIVYAILAERVSVGAMFIAGIVPGIVLGLAMMGLCTYYAHKRNYPVTGHAFSWRRVLHETRRSFIVFLMPILVIGGIIGGVFTATEGAAIAVVYALLIGFFITRKLKLSDLPVALLNAGIVSAIVGALIAFASQVTYLLTAEMVGVQIGEWLRSLTQNPLLFTLIVQLLLVVVGMFMESNAAYVMLVPIISPIAMQYGLDPVYFGFLFVMNITLGSITPPVGVLLFVASGIWRINIVHIIREVWPFIIVQYAVLFVCMLFPPIVLFLPKLVGY
jgi:TRAP-type transport system large permease protein